MTTAERRGSPLEETTDSPDLRSTPALAEDDPARALVATFGHDLRTGLALVEAPAERLAELCIHDPVATREVEAVRRELRWLEALVASMCDLDRIHDGSFVVDVEAVDPREVLQVVVDATRPLAAEFGLEVCHAQGQKGVEPVFLDRRRVETSLVTLVRFAMANIPAPGTLKLELDIDEGVVIFAVHDSGRGLSRDDVRTLFDRPRGGLSPTTTHRPVGLALVKAVAEAHGGTIDVLSAPRLGTRFELRFPSGEAHFCESPSLRLVPSVTPPSAAEALKRSPDPTSAPTDGLPAVVVVEDELNINRLIVKVLAKRYRVYSAPHGAAALPIIRSVNPVLVVTDHSMPVMTGAQLCAELRSDPATARTPVLVLTAFHKVDRHTPEYSDGPTHIMAKPFRPLELLTRVTSILGPMKLQPALGKDPVSGLTASDGFEKDASRRLAEAEPLGLILLSVSGLDQIEELNGRLVRDQTTAALGRRLEEIVRTDDLCAHLEGDTYAVLLRNVDEAEIRTVAERAVHHLGATRINDALPVSKIVSVRLLAHAGVTLSRADDTVKDVVARARQACDRAVVQGRGDVEVAA